MPTVLGLTVDDAISLLKKYSEDLSIDWSAEEYSDEYEKGKVCAQYPPVDIQVDKAGTVKLTLSAGKELVQLTDVTDREYSSAKALLEAYSFKVVRLDEYSDTTEEGKVIRTDPESLSMVEKETEVIVYVSLGSETKTIVVPNIIGYTKAQAVQILKDAGLNPGKATKVYSDSFESGIVCDQAIPENTLVEEGTTVNYSLSKGPKKSSDDSGDSGDSGDTGESGGPVG